MRVGKRRVNKRSFRSFLRRGTWGGGGGLSLSSAVCGGSCWGDERGVENW